MRQPLLGQSGRKFALPALEALRVYGEPADWGAALRMCKVPVRRVFFSGYSELPYEDGFRDAGVWNRLVASKHWKSLRDATVWYDLNTVSYGNSDETDTFDDLPGALARGRHLESLNISPWQFGSLVGCHSWGRLQSLTIMQAAGTDTSALKDCPQASQLEALALGYWDFTGRDREIPTWGEASPLAGLRRLTIMCMAADQFAALLSGPYCPGLLRLDVGRYLGAENINELAAASLPRLRHLSLGGYGDLPSLQPLVKSKAMPNLCTLHLVAGWGAFHKAAVGRAAAQLAKSKTMPHLSLVGANDAWWALRDGKALPVPERLAPLSCDWWRHDPDEDAW